MADLKLDKAVFGVEVANHELLKMAYESYLAEKRQVGAKTLKRGEVRGGGRKPWRQKGLGRARFGSSRNPIWRGGGIAFGPSGNENYKKKISKNAKHVALRQALTLVNKAKKIVVADIKVDGKTKTAAKLLASLKIENKRRILVVAGKNDVVMRSFNNLPNVEVVSPTYLTVFYILNADVIVFDTKAVEITTDWLKGVKAEVKGDK
ncbi:50S ribosomal protein L4 [Candidatus Saccharibacteria bacterium]|nr:50S ribosomal protein L4 [Candidatus Saccharibacteria bacterium]